MATGGSKYASTTERVNYARLCRVVVDLGTDVLRDVLSNYMGVVPAHLRNIVLACRDVKLEQEEKKKISTCTSFSNMDISLLYKLIRSVSVQEIRLELHRKIPAKDLLTQFQSDPSLKSLLSQEQILKIREAALMGEYSNCDSFLLMHLLNKFSPTFTPRVLPSTNRWGGNNQPLASHTTLGDDIERIRILRNKIYGHVPDTCVNDADFQTYWKELTDIMQRIDQELNTGGCYTKHLAHIKNISLDGKWEEYIHKIEEMAKSAKDFRKELSKQKEITDRLHKNYKESQSKIKVINSKQKKTQDIVTLLDEKQEKTKEEVDVLNKRQQETTSFVSSLNSRVLSLENILQGHPQQKTLFDIQIVENTALWSLLYVTMGIIVSTVISTVPIAKVQACLWIMAPVIPVNSLLTITARNIKKRNVISYVIQCAYIFGIVVGMITYESIHLPEPVRLCFEFLQFIFSFSIFKALGHETWTSLIYVFICTVIPCVVAIVLIYVIPERYKSRLNPNRNVIGKVLLFSACSVLTGAVLFNYLTVLYHGIQFLFYIIYSYPFQYNNKESRFLIFIWSLLKCFYCFYIMKIFKRFQFGARQQTQDIIFFSLFTITILLFLNVNLLQISKTLFNIVILYPFHYESWSSVFLISVWTIIKCFHCMCVIDELKRVNWNSNEDILKALFAVFILTILLIPFSIFMLSNILQFCKVLINFTILYPFQYEDWTSVFFLTTWVVVKCILFAFVIKMKKQTEGKVLVFMFAFLIIFIVVLNLIDVVLLFVLEMFKFLLNLIF